jgi:anti-sigma-K factor RskA
MDYSRKELADRLAAEYVLGTLRGPARRRFETLLPAHPALHGAVRAWQMRMQAFATPAAAVEPSARVWQGVQQRLFGAPKVAPRWWQGLRLWQGVSGLASAAALGLVILISQPLHEQPPMVIVMNGTPDGQAINQAGFVASVSYDGRALVLKPLGPVSLAQGRALELWAVPAQGAPRSLGLVSTQTATTVLRARLLINTAAFAVSLEPAGGSSTGAPTGPIISAGTI